jgi:hypothetical protein
MYGLCAGRWAAEVLFPSGGEGIYGEIDGSDWDRRVKIEAGFWLDPLPLFFCKIFINIGLGSDFGWQSVQGWCSDSDEAALRYFGEHSKYF